LIPFEADDGEVVEEFFAGGWVGEDWGFAIGTWGSAIHIGAGGAEFFGVGHGQWGVAGEDGPEFVVIILVVTVAVTLGEELEAVTFAAALIEVAGADAPDDPLEVREGEDVLF
jgi:hypothetical protein